MSLSFHISDYAAVLFDMDGVVMNSMDYHTLAWQEVFRCLGKEVPRDFILHNEGSGDIFLWMKKLFQQDLSPASPRAQLEEAVEYMRALGRRQRAVFLAKYQGMVRPYPGAGPLLRALRRQGVAAALVTSSSRLTVEAIVPSSLRECLNSVVAAEDVTRHKPAPEPYLAAAHNLKVKAGDCLVVENSPGGIAAGKAAGAACAAISSTLEPGFLGAADQVFASLEDLRVFFNL